MWKYIFLDRIGLLKGNEVSRIDADRKLPLEIIITDHSNIKKEFL